MRHFVSDGWNLIPTWICWCFRFCSAVFFLFFVHSCFETTWCEFPNSFLFSSIVNLADWVSFVKVLNDSIPTDTCFFFDGWLFFVFHLLLQASLIRWYKARSPRIFLLIVDFRLKKTVKSTLMQIWKSANIFVFIWK